MKRFKLSDCNVNELSSSELQEINGGSMMMLIMIAAFCFLMGVGISSGRTESEK
jgi:bacteriocin-like protein